MKKLLITGDKGLLGSACVREFSDDHDIISTGDIDLRNRTAVREWFNVNSPDMVIHCAAKVGGVKANRDNPVEFMLDNLWMQNNIIEASHDAGVRRLCFIATSCMFPRDAVIPVQESSLFTGKLDDSVEAYAVAKIAGWRLCKAYWEQHGDRFITVAPANIYGINDNYGDGAHVIPALMRKYDKACKAKTTDFEVWGNGEAVREFIYSDDVASAIRILINFWNSPEVVNVGSGIGTTIAEVVQAIQTTYPCDCNPIKPTWNKSEPTGIQRKTFSIDFLKKFGWTPQYSLRLGLEKTWSDYLTGKPRGL